MLSASVPAAEACPSNVTVAPLSRNSEDNRSRIEYDSVFNTELSNSNWMFEYVPETLLVSGSGNLIGQPAPSTCVPAGVPGHLSKRSETPSPSSSLFNSSTMPSNVDTRCFNASSSLRSEGSFNSSYKVDTGLCQVKSGFEEEPKENSKPA